MGPRVASFRQRSTLTALGGLDMSRSTLVGTVMTAEVVTFSLVLILLLLTFRTAVSAFLLLILGAAAVATASAGLYAIGSATNTGPAGGVAASLIARRRTRSVDEGSITRVDHFVTGLAIDTRSAAICASIES